MPPKHPRTDATASSSPRPKRPRHSAPSQTSPTPRAGADLLSPLSDELLVRILSYLALPQLLAVAPVSRRFHRLTQDSLLWKALYYARFVLPRAMRIPGFREGKMDAARLREHKLHYKGRRTLWADGRLGGLVREMEREAVGHPAKRLSIAQDEGVEDKESRVNWKRQFKIRHNWARGKCAVEELKLGPDPERLHDSLGSDGEEDRSKMLVKVVEGLAITADATFGLRAWDLKTREVVAHINLQDERIEDESAPSCLAIDNGGLGKGALDISIGFTDGSFGVWRLQEDKNLARRYRHEKSSNGGLMGMSYSHPYLLTATGAVLISLYTFDVPDKPEAEDEDETYAEGLSRPSKDLGTGGASEQNTRPNRTFLPAPYLMTSLKSHTSDPPLALSIRKTGNITVASIAYTFFTRQGWSIGIQDLHITPNAHPELAPNVTTRLAYTTPFQTGSSRAHDPSPPQTPARSRLTFTRATSSSPSTPTTVPQPTPTASRNQAGPTTLCYTHPYLLATLPDNTLILHLCTSTTTALSISPGIRLWGHTSGISDAEITARGKAVSVSSRGEEMRVWELEGRPSGVRSSRSVEIRPGVEGKNGVVDWDERRNWVGFDDEMVIVLKEARGGRESLLVYDFT